MKKQFAFVLSLVLLFTLAACGGQASTAAGSDEAEPTAAPTEEPAESTPADDSAAPAEAPDDATGDAQDFGKTLVVYFSATNNTEAVANTIAGATGGDLWELIPVVPYTNEDLDWTDPNSRVSQEHENEALRDAVELEDPVPDGWADYDTVFIGYPIWWGGAAWPVNGFIAANDFTGKTVIPFCTSQSSGLGDSAADLAAAAGTGDWLEGQRFRSGTAEQDILAWVDGLER